MQEIKFRKIYLDIMRIIAIFLVIFNHSDGYNLYTVSSGLKQWIYLLITMFTRINVPLFLMVSGSLLLGKDEKYSVVLKKRVLRFIIVLFVFSGLKYAISYFDSYLVNGSFPELEIWNIILLILAGKVPGLSSYWYIYMYIGYLFMLPFLRSIAKDMKKYQFFILLLFQFFFSAVLPCINIIFTANTIPTLAISNSFTGTIVFATTKSIFYPLMGYYLDNKIDLKSFTHNKIMLISILAMIGMIISSIFTYNQGVSTGTYTQNYVEMFDYLTTICVFIIIKWSFTYKFVFTEKCASIISMLSNLTFGIYLLDPIVQNKLYPVYINFAEPFLPTLVVSCGWCIISFVLCGGIIFLLKKIPFIKNLV